MSRLDCAHNVFDAKIANWFKNVVSSWWHKNHTKAKVELTLQPGLCLCGQALLARVKYKEIQKILGR